jgi:hypothetical protein
MIPGKEIARKPLPGQEVEEPSQVHLKEIGTSNMATTWDAPEEGQSKKRHLHLGTGAGAGLGWILSDRFDRIIPQHKRYLGRSRRTFLVALLVALLCLLALIIGLAVGLTRKSK